VLAWVERNRSLVAFGVLYLVVVLVPGRILPVDIDSVMGRVSPWGFLPRLLIAAGVLLLGSLWYAVVRPAEARHAE
jgi:hypothetical protein